MNSNNANRKYLLESGQNLCRHLQTENDGRGLTLVAWVFMNLETMVQEGDLAIPDGQYRRTIELFNNVAVTAANLAAEAARNNQRRAEEVEERDERGWVQRGPGGEIGYRRNNEEDEDEWVEIEDENDLVETEDKNELNENEEVIDKQRVHLGIKNFPRLQCSMVFASKYKLKRHQLTHEGQRVVCDDCGKELSSLAHLQRHKLVHYKAPLGTFSCDVCNKNFSRKDSLTRHEKNHKKII